MDTLTPITAHLLSDSSLEITAKDVTQLPTLAGRVAPGTRVHVTSLGTENLEMRLSAAAAARHNGFVPVPHLSARRLTSAEELRRFLGGLRDVGASEQLFVVGGDPVAPEGPFADALSIIVSGELERVGARQVGIAGYPEGHPHVVEAELWAALREKVTALQQRGIATSIITQFAFDADPVLQWISLARDRGIDGPIRVGVPGPAGIKQLLRYARRFGIGTGTEVVRKYGLSLTQLIGTAGPDRFVGGLAARYDPARHGEVSLHFFTFGGLAQTADWIVRADQEATA